MAQERGTISQVEKQTISIRDLPINDRPRERLVHLGGQALSSPELLSIVLKNGTSGENALHLAERLLVTFGGLPGLAHASIAELTNIKGIGPDKAVRIRAAIELGRRLMTNPNKTQLKITTPSDAALLLMADMSKLNEEQLRAIFLDTRNGVLGVHTVLMESLSISGTGVKDVFRPAIKANAAAIILAHNQLSDWAYPSPNDIQLVQDLVKAGNLFSVTVLDHLIIARQRYVSLKERGNEFDLQW